MLHFETYHSATGKLPAEGDIDMEIFRVRVEEGDARKAEAHQLTSGDVDPMQKIRTFLRRGQLAEAEVLLAEIDRSADAPDARAEILLESARLAVFEGQWENAVKLGRAALELSPGGVTQLALHQVCANASYEIGRFDQAMKSIEAGTTLCRLFPHGSLGTYLEATHLKILLAQGEFLLAEKRLEQSLKTLWHDPKKNADLLLALLRVRIDLLRRSGRPYESSAFASWILARTMGDQLYADFASLDLYFLFPTDESPWRREAGLAVARYNRVRDLFESVVEGRPFTSSARSLAERARPGVAHFCPDHAAAVTQIIFIQSSMSVDLRDLKVRGLSLTSQFRQALATLAFGPRTKQDFFAELWGSQKFSPQLHDPVIRSLLRRLRQTGLLDVRTTDAGIVIDASLLVTES